MAGLRIRSVPRDADLRVLHWLRLRSRGLSCYQIGKRLGVNSGAVVGETNKVLAADLAESGEAAELVRGGYWR